MTSLQFNSLSIQFNSTQFNSIQFNSIQLNSLYFNSIQQFNSVHFTLIQFNSISLHIFLEFHFFFFGFCLCINLVFFDELIWAGRQAGRQAVSQSLFFNKVDFSFVVLFHIFFFIFHSFIRYQKKTWFPCPLIMKTPLTITTNTHITQVLGNAAAAAGYCCWRWWLMLVRKYQQWGADSTR